MLIIRLIMKTEDAIKLFKGVRPLAEALGITREAIYQWGDSVPALRVYQIKDLVAARAEAPSTSEPHQEAAPVHALACTTQSVRLTANRRDLVRRVDLVEAPHPDQLPLALAAGEPHQEAA